MSGKLKDLNINKESIDKFIAQAKESVKVLEVLQKEGVEIAKSFLPAVKNTKVLDTFKKLGLATRAEVKDLEKKVEQLTAELRKKG